MYDFFEKLDSIHILYFISIASILLLLILINYYHKNAIYNWAPTTIFAFVFGYYTIAGPFVFINNNLTKYRYIEHMPYLENAWQIAFLSIFSFLFGYYILPVGRPRINSITSISIAIKLNKKLLLITLLSVLIFAGTGGLLVQLNFLEAGGNPFQGYTGAFRNYLLQTIDFLIPGTIVLLVGFMLKKTKLMYFIISFTFAIAIFSAQGFRWRLVVLLLGLVMSYYLIKKTNVNILILSIIAFVLIPLLGLIGLTRQYGSGLNITKSKQYQNEEIFLAGFYETSTFFDTGMLINYVPSKFDYIGWDPLVQSLVFPIPRAIWPSKPSGEYIKIYERMYGNGDLGKGVAVLNYGEYYLAFGWIGVLLGFVLLGWGYRKLWNWYVVNQNNPVATVLYSVSASFMYVVISRGYLPQVTMLFVFTVGPAIWLFKNSKKLP